MSDLIVLLPGFDAVGRFFITSRTVFSVSSAWRLMKSNGFDCVQKTIIVKEKTQSDSLLGSNYSDQTMLHSDLAGAYSIKVLWQEERLHLVLNVITIDYELPLMILSLEGRKRKEREK